MSEYVYVIEMHGLTKIGRSVAPNKRVRNMQLPGKPLGSWYRVTDSHEVERRAHQTFAPNRVYGEWFALSDEQKGELHCLLTEAALISFSSALRICTDRKPIKRKEKFTASQPKQCR